MLPLSLAELLGVELDREATSLAAGISGDKLTIHYGDVNLQIDAGDEEIKWRSKVGFVDFGSPDQEVIILGHSGCLDFFTAIFNGELAELEMVPNSLLADR